MRRCLLTRVIHLVSHLRRRVHGQARLVVVVGTWRWHHGCLGRHLRIVLRLERGSTLRHIVYRRCHLNWIWLIVHWNSSWVVRCWHQVVHNDLLSTSTERILETFAVTVVSETSHCLRGWLVIDVSLLSNLNESLDLFSLFWDSDVNVGCYLFKNIRILARVTYNFVQSLFVSVSCQ